MPAQYLPEGTRLIVRKDRCMHGAGVGVTLGDNGGTTTEIKDSALLQLVLGPALVENLGENNKEVWVLLNQYGPSYKVLYNQMEHPHVYRYTLRDGQRFLFAVCAQGVNMSLLLQDKPAHHFAGDEDWEKPFLENE